MALSGNCFPSKRAVMAACYQDECAANFNLASGCEHKTFDASTPQMLETGPASVLMAKVLS